MCVYPFSCEGGVNLSGDHWGFILSNKAKTSQEGSCGRQPEEISAKVPQARRKLTLKMDAFRVAQHVAAKLAPYLLLTMSLFVTGHTG